MVKSKTEATALELYEDVQEEIFETQRRLIQLDAEAAVYRAQLAFDGIVTPEHYLPRACRKC